MPSPAKLFAHLAISISLCLSGRASPDSVVTFNEIHYHPPAAADEWIELHNQMAVRVDLSGWAITGGVEFTFPEGTVIEPGELIVVAAIPAGIAGALGPWDGRLDNRGEKLQLLGRHGRLMDELSYDDAGSWPVGPDGSGSTLAKRHPEAASPPARNWRPSAQAGGTPGAHNFDFGSGDVQTPVIPPRGEWRFQAAPADPGDAWRHAGFDDSGWDLGRVDFASSHLRNPSFEAEVFGTQPGTIATNSAISDWLAMENGSPGGEGFIGLNSPGSLDLFSNNGAVPDGGNVAFIRGGPRSLSQTVSGLVPGSRYIVRYRENGRAPTAPIAEVTLGGVKVIPAHTVTSVENAGQFTRPYAHSVSDVFTATADSHQLEVSNLADIGQSLLMDDLRLEPVALHDTFSTGGNLAGRAPEFRLSDATWSNSDPGSIQVQAGGLAKSGTGTATASLPFSPGEDTALTLSARLNPGSGSTTRWSAVGFSGSAGTEPLDQSGVLWLRMQEDGGVVLEANEDGAGTGVIAVSSPGSAPVYPFQPDDLNEVDLIWERDGNTATVIINGVTVFNSVGLDNNAGGEDDHFGPEVRSVAATFATAGARLDELALAERAEPNWPLPFAPTTSASYFRRAFDFAGDPSQATLILSLAAADGALVWLNGEELLRANLPAGAIDPTTPALSDAGVAETFVLPGTLLSPSGNVLAVQVHPAAGRTGIRFDASLVVASPVAAPDQRPPIALNEIAPAGSDQFFVELKSLSNAPVSLDGLVLELAGSAPASFSLPPSTLAAGAVISFDPGFTPADEDRLFLKDQTGSLIDAARVKNRLRGKLGENWQFPLAATPGAANQFVIPDGVVINEIMYHHRPTYPDRSNGVAFAEDATEWIELHNRGSSEVDIGGWQLRDAVRYEFPPGTTIAPGGFLVVSGEQFSGELNNRGERIELRDANDNIADEVTYHDGGRWPKLADGGGSSLELIDPATDNRSPESWAASDESGAAGWQAFSYSGPAVEPSGNNNPDYFNEFLVGLLDAGEVLIDDVSVIENPGGAELELVQNGDFEGDALGSQPDGWRILGTHLESRVVADPAGGGQVLSLRATGRLEHSYNLASTTFLGNRAIQAGANYRISFRARWVSGSPQLNTRLYFNRLSRTHIVPQPATHGTPGAPNSTLVANAGPVISQLAHSPIVPAPGEIVRISAEAEDPDGILRMTLLYRDADGERAWTSTPMSGDPAGNFVGVIPPQPDRSVIQFFVQASDNDGAVSTLPRRGENSSAFFRVGDGGTGARAVQTMRLIMDPDDAEFMHTAHHTPSNYRHGATVIYNDREVFYGCGIRLRGSAYGRRGGRVGWNVKFPDDQLFRGAHSTVALDGGYSVPIGQGNGWIAVGPGVATNELVYNQMAHRAGGIPATFDDVGYIDAPLASDSKLAQLKMARFGDIFLQSELGSDEGERFKFELIYHPRSTLDGNPESLKSVYSAVLGVDIREMGNDGEAYRHNFWVQNHPERDDYSRIADMGRAMDSAGPDLQRETDAVLDIDNWMRVLAYQALTGTADTYNNGLAHNLLFYVRPDEERKVMVFPWDVDHAFFYRDDDSIYGRASHRASAVINIPQNNRLYCGHLRHLCNTGFNPSYIAPWVSHFNQVADLPIAGHYTQWIADRRNHVLARLNTEHPPVEFRITTNGGNDFSVAAPSVEIRGDGWIDVREIKLGQSGESLETEWLDASTWRVEVPLLGGPNPIELIARDHDGAEVGRDSITVTNSGSIEPAAASNLAISEIMYHPADPDGAEMLAGFTEAENFEFVELMNIGSSPVDLDGARFLRGIDLDLPPVQLAPGARTLLVRHRASFEHRYGPGLPIAAEYGDPADPDGGPKLSNGGERLRLEDRGGGTIRDFSYDDRAPWPEGADGTGGSLTLIRPLTDPDHSAPASWRASVAAGGSPGTGDASTLAAWLDSKGFEDPGEDPDGDGFDHFMTYALGIDLAGTAALPRVQLDGSGRPVLTVHQRRSADDITLTVETSNDLLDWHRDPGDGSVIERIATSSLPGGTSELQFRASSASPTGGRQYLRVVVTN